jgi:hypothetical protein
MRETTNFPLDKKKKSFCLFILFMTASAITNTFERQIKNKSVVVVMVFAGGTSGGTNSVVCCVVMLLPAARDGSSTIYYYISHNIMTLKFRVYISHKRVS